MPLATRGMTLVTAVEKRGNAMGGIASDLFSFVGRLAVGTILIAHGLQKFLDWRIDGTTRNFEQLGVPMPALSAWFAALTELVGGVLLILGLALPLVGLVVAIDMAGALFQVHLQNGLFAPNGYELVLALGATTLALGFNGGRWSLDYGLFGRRSGTATRADSQAS